MPPLIEVDDICCDCCGGCGYMVVDHTHTIWKEKEMNIHLIFFGGGEQCDELGRNGVLRGIQKKCIT